MTDERDIYSQVADDLHAQYPGRDELAYHDSVAHLLAGHTVVASVQAAQTRTPRRFLWFRGLPIPHDRLWLAIMGLVASALSLAVSKID